MTTVLAALHHRGLQYLLPRPGQQGDFQHKLWLDFGKAALSDLQWWERYINSPSHSSTSLVVRPASLELWIDAPGVIGWGGHCSCGQQVQGRLIEQQMPWHINLKELEAAQLSLCGVLKQGNIVQLHMDSMVAVAFVNRQGGTRLRILCTAALALWQEVLGKPPFKKSS